MSAKALNAFVHVPRCCSIMHLSHMQTRYKLHIHVSVCFHIRRQARDKLHIPRVCIYYQYALLHTYRSEISFTSIVSVCIHIHRQTRDKLDIHVSICIHIHSQTRYMLDIHVSVCIHIQRQARDKLVIHVSVCIHIQTQARDKLGIPIYRYAFIHMDRPVISLIPKQLYPPQHFSSLLSLPIPSLHEISFKTSTTVHFNLKQ